MMHLVDTSVWVDFLRGVSNDKVHHLEALIEEGDACINPVIFSELCFGARGEAQYASYERRFSDLPFLDIPENWHLHVARMGYRLRDNGYRPFLADILIALTALHHGVPLLTKDKDFNSFHKFFNLQLA